MPYNGYYLTNRTQFVNLIGIRCKNKNISCGVPQGFIPETLLFIIYINDMYQAVDSCIVHHFSDNTNLLFGNKNINIILSPDTKHFVPSVGTSPSFGKQTVRTCLLM